MTQLNVVLATGVPELDEAIQQRITKVNIIGNALYKEAVEDVVQRKQPNVIILSELLDGVITIRELVLKLRTKFPDARIIYIMKEDSPREKSFLYQWSVFDILPSKFGVGELEEALFNPKEFKHVAKEFDNIKDIDDIINEPVDVSGMNNIDEGKYTKINSPGAGTDRVYQQIVSFWSVRDGVGKTFAAVNTSLMLATSRDLKILLLDFNLENPCIHLQYKFYDAQRNLGSILEDAKANVEITKDNLDDYLFTHPVYKNLKILPGSLLKVKRPDSDFVFKVFKQIISAAEQSNFSTILIDNNSGLEDPLTVNILKESSKILLFSSEEPSSLNSVRRCFDAEIGDFIPNKINKKAVIPVVNKSYNETRLNYKRALELSLELRVGAIIPHDEEVRKSMFTGQPVLSKKPPEDMYNSFILISNAIHKDLFRKPISRSKTKNKETKAKNSSNNNGLFGGLFGKNKK